MIANRGEIAVRVIRAAKELGLATVAVYSEADAGSAPALLADEAVCIGPAESRLSYLDADKILAAAKATGADAIHPGFGFLSERSEFARACAKAGVKFIGPSPEVIDIMGDKLSAKAAMKKAGVPTVPGSEGALKDADEAVKIAKKIGYPVLLKAAAGGGGKGMRLAQDEKSLREGFESTQREALNYFGNADVFLEKFILGPHHIEVQLIGDEHGNVCHLFERECSVQRRHQKVIEEAPSPFLDGHDDVRAELFKVAVEGARKVGYTNAGTMEFVMGEDRSFYFLEMNTRIQVEHPVTELITGIDLVREQILVAMGEKLSFTQKELTARGAAVECRLYAENPYNFLPSPGLIRELWFPGGPFVRVDTAMQAGQRIPLEYDPMIAKLCAWGRKRPEALDRMARALAETLVGGSLTNLEFLRRALANDVFRGGCYTTNFIRENEKDLTDPAKPPVGLTNEANLRAALAALARHEAKTLLPAETAEWWREPHA